MIVGTAGHIDHGKTSLVKRLTGRDTDRLPEEIQRGISIELGYAYVPLADGQVIGFVDVPGHEKFVHTMVAGATGIDFALLVVAADDGVMPQTIEHLQILLVLAVADGAIVLNKIDRVDAARRMAVRAQIAACVHGTPAAAWPLFELSAATGAGVDALWSHLVARAQAATARACAGHFRLAVDRVFTLTGAGTVVTGTVHAGLVRVGDEVAIAPAGLRARVRSLHAQDRPAMEGRAGQRCALALVGVEKNEVERGQWVQGSALQNVSERFDATVALSPLESRGLSNWATVHLHHGTADVMARIGVLDAEQIAPGEARLATISTDRPLALCRGDRFVLRDAQARRTLGGGVVLDIAPPRRGKRRPERLQVLAALRDATPQEALATWLQSEALSLARIAHGWNLTDGDLQAMLNSLHARVAAGTAFAASYWAQLRMRLLQALATAHEREPEMPGVEQNRLRRMVAPSLTAEAFSELVEELLAEARLVRRSAFLALPEHRAELGKNERILWERIKPLLMEKPFQPPRVRDIARERNLPENEVRALLKRVARVGEVTLVAHDHFFLTDAVRALADIAAELSATRGAARAAEFRDRIGTGRKLAIQILEFFDRVGYTRRVRDDHLLRRPNPWREGAPGP
ncbi:MAG: selenocysteine-specific translation elongation factor [Sutterellaceae bacterium]|nr:selenocysteine-specific translation elongation factor [Burkholderiaceae bacterium]MCX7901490.1 selenocysteine-specific translation elongation factor [Burkholderiaceae bacterium]MDW8430076.1 selenocysteine-specific translation elongation factor [Sutterellaceae bacterium]